MKKILLLLLVFVISIFPSLNVQASKLPTIKVGSCYAYKDEVVTIPITLKDNKGFNYLGAKIRYNTDELEYVSSDIIGLANASIKTISINKHKTITLYALTKDDTLMYDNGKIATIDFKVLKDNVNEIPIEIQVDNFGQNDSDIEIKQVNGSIKFANHEVVKNKKKVKPTIKEAEKKKIVWTTSDKEIATIDKKGNIDFKKEGTVRVIGKDENGNIVFDKTYKVDKNDLKKKDKPDYILIIPIVILISAVIMIVGKTKLLKKKK